MIQCLPLPTQEMRDVGLIPESGRSPVGGNGTLRQYSCLENSMDRGAWWSTVQGRKESDTTEQLSTHSACFLGVVAMEGLAEKVTFE